MSSAAERAILCRCCGTSWCAPDGDGRGARWVCGRCQEILVHGAEPEGSPAAPFVRRYGMRAGSLWGWLVGGTWWLPAVLASSVLRGQVDAWAFLLLSVPGVATVYWLVLRRRGTPSVVWRGYVGLGAGGYAWYLCALLPRYLLELGALGAAGVLAGGGCLWWHASLVRRLPRLEQEWAPSEAAADPGGS
jgi:hypothetical protein